MRRIILVLSLVACGKGGGDKAAGGARDAVIDAWKAEKLTVSALTPATVAFGKDCQGGTVEGIDVLLCNFATPAEAKAAAEQGYTWVGSATGTSEVHGAALVVLADRRKVDPSGRTINRLMKLAPK
ncbi:MAG TPA: hypothetical protein VHN14_15675 [Kofleriaceae bacterium]|jgi:hypothetical protein|nr:hypothetical protein [Kofleriaceae bacterium]